MSTSEGKFLEKIEKSVYAALLAKWPQTIAEISLMTNIPEQEVESTINSLTSKNLVEKLEYDVDVFIGKSIIPEFQAKAVAFLDNTLVDLTNGKDKVSKGNKTIKLQIEKLHNSLVEFNSLLTKTIDENEKNLVLNLKTSSLETVDTLNQGIDKIVQNNLERIRISKEKYNSLLIENSEGLNTKVNDILSQVEEWSSSAQNKLFIEDFNQRIIQTNQDITNEAKKLEKTFREQHNMLEENIVRIIKQNTSESISLNEETNEDFKEGLNSVQEDFNTYLDTVKSEGFEKVQQDIFEGINTLVGDSTKLFIQSITKNQKNVTDLLEKKLADSDKVINTSVGELLSKITIAINNTSDTLKRQKKDIKSSLSKVPNILKSLEDELNIIHSSHSSDILHELEDYHSSVRNQIKIITKDIISLEKQKQTNITKTLKEIVLEFQKINTEIVSILERNSEVAIKKSDTVNKALSDSKDSLIRHSNMFSKDLTENIFSITDPLQSKIKEFNEKKLPKLRDDLLTSTETQKSTITDLKNKNTDIIEEQLGEVEKIELQTDVSRKELIEDIRRRLEAMVKEIGRNFVDIGNNFETKVIEINNTVEKLFSELTKKLQSSWKNSKELVGKEQKNQKDLIAKNLNEYSTNLNSNLQNINSSISSELDVTLSMIEKEFVKVKGQIKKEIDENSEVIDTSFSTIQKELSVYLSEFTTTTENFYETNFSDFESATKTTIDDLMTYIKEERDGIIQIYDEKESELYSVSEKTITDVVSYFGNINTMITEVSNKLRSILIGLSANTKKTANDLSVISTSNITLVKTANKTLIDETTKILEDLNNLRTNIDLRLNEILQSSEKNLVSDFDNAITQINGLSTDIINSSNLEKNRINNFTKTQIEKINQEYIESIDSASREHILALENEIASSKKEYEETQAKNKLLFEDAQAKMISRIQESTTLFDENINQRGNQTVDIISQTVNNSEILIQKLESDINKNLDSLKDSLDLNPDVISFPEEEINAEISETANKVKFNYEAKTLMLSSELNRLTEEYSEKVNTRLKSELEKQSVNYKTTKDELLEIERQKTQELRNGAEKLQETVSTFLTFLPDRMKEPMETLSEKTLQFNNESTSNLANATKEHKAVLVDHLDQQKENLENISRNIDDSYEFNTNLVTEIQKETKDHFKKSSEVFNKAIEKKTTSISENSRNDILKIGDEFKEKLVTIKTVITEPLQNIESKIIPNIEESLSLYDKSLKRFTEEMIDETSTYLDKYTKDFDTYLIKTETDVNKFILETVKKAENLLVILTPDISLLPDLIFKEEVIPSNIRIRILTSSVKSDLIQKLYRKKINMAIYETEEKIEDICFISANALVKYTHTKDKRIWGLYTTKSEALRFYNNFLMNQAFKDVNLISRTSSPS